MPPPHYLILAKILRPHGVRGDFNMLIITDFPDRLNQVQTVYLSRDPGKPGKPFTVAMARRHNGDQWLLHLDGIDTREEAEPLRNHYLLIPLDDAVPLDEDELYLYQVMGVEVRTEAGEILGHVTDFIETGANDVYVIGDSPYGEILIPAIPQVVLNIDAETKIMTVQLMDGLLPDPRDHPEDDSADAPPTPA